MKGDYGNLSVRSAKEQLQAISGAKDFLRGNQEEFPNRHGYYQKQIDSLTMEEEGLSSWLKAKGPVGVGEPKKMPLIIGKGGNPQRNVTFPLIIADDSDDDWDVPVYDSEGNLLNTMIGDANEMPKIKFLSDDYTLSGRIDIDPDGDGTGTYYAPDGSGISLNDFPVIDNGAEAEKVDSKTVWELIRDWVDGDDGEIDNGSIQTDPESNKTYYISPSTEKIPISKLGVDEGDINTISADGSDKTVSGNTYTVNPSVTKHDSENTYTNEPSTELISVDDTSQDSSDGYPEGLSSDTPYTEENKAKYNAIYEANQEEIQMLEAQKKSMAAVEGGPGFYTPDIDNRLAVLYTQNRRIDEWRSAEKKAEEVSDNGENADSNQQSANTGAAGTGFGGQSSGGGGGRDGDLGSDLGVLSAKYESNGDPGAIGDNPGDPGGKSYGAYQLASKKRSVDAFLEWLKVNSSEYYQRLMTAKQNDGDTFGTNFDNAWKQIAEADPSGFFNLQHSYIKYAYYDPLAKQLKDEYGFDINTKSKALQNVFWSTSVQHRYDTIDIFVTAGLSGNDEQIINGVYDERKLYFSGSSEEIKRSVINRFESERVDALKMLKGQ